jgi:hypothetical protein
MNINIPLVIIILCYSGLAASKALLLTLSVNRCWQTLPKLDLDGLGILLYVTLPNKTLWHPITESKESTKVIKGP